MLQFKPDGKGGWTFTCQHGNNECIGNLYQACLLDGLNGWMPSDNRYLNPPSDFCFAKFCPFKLLF